jgi:hypothetical protein
LAWRFHLFQKTRAARAWQTDFLGFTFICGKTRAGRFQLQRKTRRDRMRALGREARYGLADRAVAWRSSASSPVPCAACNVRPAVSPPIGGADAAPADEASARSERGESARRTYPPISLGGPRPVFGSGTRARSSRSSQERRHGQDRDKTAAVTRVDLGRWWRTEPSNIRTGARDADSRGSSAANAARTGLSAAHVHAHCRESFSWF